MIILGETRIENLPLGQKDAVHAPCVLVTCHTYVEPGESVKFVNEGLVSSCSTRTREGIVDPFITGGAPPGTNFWVLIEPGLVSGLTHNFEINVNALTAYDESDGEPVTAYDDENDCKSMGCN